MIHPAALAILTAIALASVAGPASAVSVDGPGSPDFDSIAAQRQAELDRFNRRIKALKLQPPGIQRGIQVAREVQRHQAENKRLSMEHASLRRQVVDDLGRQWSQVESDWQRECARHDGARRQMESLPDGPERAAKIEAERATHRARSNEIAVRRNAVHEGVMRQANIDARGGSPNASGQMRQTAGTRVGDPNFRGMHGDFDAGAGYRTTEKAAKILSEIGVKGPSGGGVKVRNGVVETSAEFGMTVNADAGLDRVGSSGHQAQIKQASAHGETYISESGGRVQSQTLKDHLATLDHTKKAMHGLHENPGALVGGTPEGQALAKGALKAADQAGLSQKTVESIARQHGVKDPGGVLERLAEIKSQRAQISDADEAARLQRVARDILNASEAATQAKAAAEVKHIESRIAELEAKGSAQEAHRLRQEIADYRAKSRAASEVFGPTDRGAGPGRGTTESSVKKGGARGDPATKTDGGIQGEPQSKMSPGRKLISGAGLILGIYGIYEGYRIASKEIEENRKEEQDAQGPLSSAAGALSGKSELVLRTLWHGLGFGQMSEIGGQAGRDAYEQYKKDIADGKVSPDSWRDYFEMKGSGVLTGVFQAGKAITYDMARQSLANLGEATKELAGVSKDSLGAIRDRSVEIRIHEERSKTIFDTLVKKGASEEGARRAADAVKKGDYSEAKRLSKVLEGKLAVKRADEQRKKEAERQRAGRRDREKRAVRREAQQSEQAARDKATEKQIELRETVIAKLRAKGLPTAVSLVDRLTAILERDGMSALDAAIAEMTGMQGSFTGRAFDTGVLRISVKGTRVTGTFTDTIRASESAGDIVITVTTAMNGTLMGDVELSSGSISFKMAGTSVTEIHPSGRKTSVPCSASFSGSFTGKGYKGTSSGKIWSATRSGPSDP